jgi:hypothetical protein
MKKLILGLSLLTSITLAEDHALIVGCCGQYKAQAGISLLKGTTNDAKHIYDILLDRGVQDKNIDYLVESDATYHNITSKLKAKNQNNLLNKGDTLYVYYSGHGTSVGDRSVFGKKLSSDKDLLNRLNNSAGLIPYDFDLNDPKHTLIITSRDFKPTFQALDAKGVNIVWIADACYAGNAHRSTNSLNPKKLFQDYQLTEKAQKSLKKENAYHANKNNNLYENLIFFGATLTTNMTEEVNVNDEYRGAFSVQVENCLKKRYNNSNITNKNLKECLEKNFVPFMFSSAIYPIDTRLDKRVIIKAPKKSEVKIEHLLNYRDKLFALQSKQSPLKMNISSTKSPSLALDTFCFGEALEINISNKSNDELVMAFTMDSENRVIILTPNADTNRFSKTNKVVEANVTEPFGKDKVKVFTTTDKTLYQKISKFKNNVDGLLKDKHVQEIYNAFKKSGDFKAAYTEVTTVKTDVSICRNGDVL